MPSNTFHEIARFDNPQTTVLEQSAMQMLRRRGIKGVVNTKEEAKSMLELLNELQTDALTKFDEAIIGLETALRNTQTRYDAATGDEREILLIDLDMVEQLYTKVQQERAGTESFFRRAIRQAEETVRSYA